MIGELLELRLQVGDLRVHRILALRELLRLLGAAGAGLIEAVDVGLDRLLLGGELVGLPLRALQIALAARALIALELLLRLAQPRQRFGRLRAAVAGAVGGRALHRVRRVLHAAHRFGDVLLLLLIARQLL